MQRLIGVNFTSKRLHASVVDVHLRSSKKVKEEEVLLPENSEERENLILDSLKRWKKEYSPGGIVFGIPLSLFSCQLIEMPSMKKADLRKALAFDLEQYLPLPVDEYVFDFTTSSGGKDRIKVLVFSIRKTLIEKFLKYANDAELDILTIRCNTIEALRGLMEITGDKRMKGIFIQVADDSFEILAIKDSNPVLVKVLSKDSDLVYEIDRLLQLYPGMVYYTGAVDLQTSEKFNSRKYHVSVQETLARSAKGRSSLNLNFLPAEFVKKGIDYYPYILGGLSAAAVVLFLLTGFIVYFKDARALRNIETRISSIQKKASGLIGAKKKLDMLQNDRMFLMDFKGRSNISVKVLSNMSMTVPDTAWLINMNLDDQGNIEIEGFTEDTSGLIMALENSESFRNVSFTSPIVTKNGEERFALKLEVEGL